MEELTVFDIQRFALHDGPGIRTTVFLKGCPLNCLWCHNPESKRPQPQLSFLEKNCVSCRRCQSVCPRQVHLFDTEGRHHVAFGRCIRCGACAKACLRHALKLFGMAMTPDEILQVVVKDRDFYERSGGGLTVSGGEPMLQFDGLLALLQQAKAEGLHVCLDTSGQAPTERYAQIAPYVDCFLFDYKLTGEALHKQYTGVGQTLILQNLEWLCTHGCHMILRCPMIPGVNLFPAHYDAIAALSRRYDAIKTVNLMPYHDMAKGKAAQIGEAYALSEVKTMSAEQTDALYAELAARGCRNLSRS